MASISALNTLTYTRELCIGCAMRVQVCPHGVFGMQSGIAKPMRADACMECGACQLNCPAGAVRVESGVGCAGAMIRAALTGRRKEVGCG